jgi:hypothetical protein
MARPKKEPINIEDDPTLQKDRYVRLDWGAAYLDVSVDFLRGKIASGDLKVSRLGPNVYRVKISALDKLAASN